MEIDWMEYLDPKLVFLVAFIYLVGMFIKPIDRIDNKFIPIILWGVAILVSIIFYLITPEQSLAECIFNGVIQGTFVAGLAVFGNQMFKQLGNR